MACGSVAHRDSLQGGREGEVMVFEISDLLCCELESEIQTSRTLGTFPLGKADSKPMPLSIRT